MKITTDKYDERINQNLDNFFEQIEPLSSFKGGEYGPAIQDYEKVLAPTTNRYIEPYKTSCHGEWVYYGMKELIEITNPKSILDLGCGMGEFLNTAKQFTNADLYGCTIHIGEVKAAKAEYNLSILAADMRLIDQYFCEKSIDLVVANASLHFLNESDQQKVADAVYKILSDTGRYVIIHYKDPEHFTMRNPLGFIEVQSLEGFIGPTYMYKKVL